MTKTKLKKNSLPPNSTPLTLFFIHDSNLQGMYHLAPSIDHLSHALGCCDLQNEPSEVLITPIANILSLKVTPFSLSSRSRKTIRLIDCPPFVEAQRLLSQAKASTDAPSLVTNTNTTGELSL